MNELVKKLLLSMGYSAAQIAEMEKSDTTLKVEDLTTVALEHHKTLLNNDNAFVSSIKNKGKAEVHDLYERAFKKHGLKAEDLKDEKGENKKPEDVVKTLTDKANEGKDKTLVDLQNENIALKNKVVDLEEKEIPKIKGEVELEKKKLDIRESLVKKYSSYGDLRNPVEVVEATLGIEFGKNGYTIEKDDKGKLIFKGKDGLQLKNAAGTALLTEDEIIKEALTRNKFIAESNADETDSTKKVKPDPKKEEQEKKEFTSPGLSKAEAHLVNMQKKEAPKV